MTSALLDWPRPQYQHGGGDAFLFYVVFGCVDSQRELSRSKYQCDGVPVGLEIMQYGLKCHPEVTQSFRDGYLWTELEKGHPRLADTIRGETDCTVLRGTVKDSLNLNYLRDAVGLITFFLDNGGVAIYDPQMFHWWPADQWRERIFMPAAALPHRHVVILVSDEGDGTDWIHTRGLRKFGRPDLSIHWVPAALKTEIIELCERFIEMQAFGAIVADGQAIRMRALPSGMYCRHGGHVDDPDFNNRHVEVLWS